MTFNQYSRKKVSGAKSSVNKLVAKSKKAKKDQKNAIKAKAKQSSSAINHLSKTAKKQKGVSKRTALPKLMKESIDLAYDLKEHRNDILEKITKLNDITKKILPKILQCKNIESAEREIITDTDQGKVTTFMNIAGQYQQIVKSIWPTRLKQLEKCKKNWADVSRTTSTTAGGETVEDKKMGYITKCMIKYFKDELAEETANDMKKQKEKKKKELIKKKEQEAKKKTEMAKKAKLKKKSIKKSVKSEKKTAKKTVKAQAKKSKKKTDEKVKSVKLEEKNDTNKLDDKQKKAERKVVEQKKADQKKIENQYKKETVDANKSYDEQLEKLTGKKTNSPSELSSNANKTTKSPHNNTEENAQEKVSNDNKHTKLKSLNELHNDSPQKPTKLANGDNDQAQTKKDQ